MEHKIAYFKGALLMNSYVRIYKIQSAPECDAIEIEIHVFLIYSTNKAKNNKSFL